MLTIVAEETWGYIMTKARDQDLFHFFIGIQENFGARRFLVERFEANYDTVRRVPH